MKTYNFIVWFGTMQFYIAIDTKDEDAAIDLVADNYPPQDGWRYMLIQWI